MLDALLSMKNVTSAAQLMMVSQPTMSTALRTLRVHFSDDLLRRVGSKYELTPLAHELRPLLQVVLAGAERTFSMASAFDPASSDRRFTVMSSDYGVSTLGARASLAFSDAAPSASLVFLPYDVSYLDHTEEKLRNVDAMLMPTGVIHGFPHLELTTDEWVCVVSSDNSAVGSDITMEDLASMPWVSPSTHLPIAPMLQLSAMGYVPQVEVEVDSFALVPALVVGTSRIAIMQRSLAELMGHGRLRIIRCPFPVADVVQNLWWHPRHDLDPGHQWMRGIFDRA
jgi:DNA-binding transcriptional LysR family regulator